MYFVILIWCCGSMSCVMCESYTVRLRSAVDVLVVPYSVSVLNCNFSKEQSMLPEDDRMIETCMSVLSVLM